MSLSRGRNPNNPDSEESQKKGSDESSDDDVFIVPSSKLKPNIATKTKDPASKRNQNKQVKVTFPKKLASKKQVEPANIESQDQIEKEGPKMTDTPVPAEVEVAVHEDTLVALEEQIGRRFDENSEPNQQHCFDIVLEPKTSDSENSTGHSLASGQVVCPFCWKKLNDKLSGMTHVKACGKNLPIERIFEALQLHERQVKEWEQIGISYPGFANPKSKASANANSEETGRTRNKRGGGTTRRKKQNIVEDPDVELAMALSASLQEEYIERQRAEINHLTEAGLHNEAVEKARACDTNDQEQKSERTAGDAISEFRLRFSKETKKLQKTNSSTQVAPKPRSGRSKPKDLKNTKLFTLSENEKAAILAERVAHILEKTEEKTTAFKELPRLTDGQPNQEESGRLKEFCNKESKLWNMSSAMTALPDEEFYTKALKECKMRTQEHVSGKLKISEVKSNLMTDPQTNIQRPSTVPSAPKVPALRNSKKSESFTGSGGHAVEKTTCKLGQDFLQLFVRKIGTDVTLYGREEKPIRVHKLILQARCPRMLQEVVIEENSNGTKSEIIPLTCFSHLSVKSFTWYLYSGQLLPFQSNDSEQAARYLEELEELAQKFNIQLDEDQHQINQGSKSASPNCRCGVEKTNQEIQTEPFVSLPRPMPLERISEAEVGNSELTTESIPHDDEGDDHCNFLDQDNLEQNDYNSSKNSLIEDEDLRTMSSKEVTGVRRKSTDSAGSVDLFEDCDENYENEDEDNQNEFVESQNSDKSLDNALKRSRSLSPRRDDSIILGDSPFSQANKKYKLDTCNNSSLPPVDEQDQVDEVSLPRLSDCERQSAFDDILSEILSPCSAKTFPRDKLCVSGDISTPVSRYSGSRRKATRISETGRTQPETTFKSRLRSSQASENPVPTSTPLCPPPPSNNFLELNHDNPFPFDQEDNDNIWNNDSVFASIPEDLLYRNSPQTSSSRYPARFSPELSPIPVHASYVSKTKCQQPDNDIILKPNSKSKKGRPKGNNNRKNASSSQPLQQRNTYEENLALFTTRNCPTTPTNTFGAQSQDPSRPELATNNQSPLLNYSTIDTPILKRELKRYGLKPLPRSKAKLLLRHIYKETHKPDYD